jgi:hypothetical protein
MQILPAPFSQSGAPLSPRTLAAGLIASVQKPFEAQTTLMGRAHQLALTWTGSIGLWQALEISRPAIVWQATNSLATTPGLPYFNPQTAVEFTPGDTPDSSIPIGAMSANGRQFILPWAGRWNLRVALYEFAPSASTAVNIVYNVQEAPPGVTASDLLALWRDGCANYTHRQVNIAANTNVIAKPASPVRKTLIMVNNQALAVFYTVNDVAATATTGIPLAGGAIHTYTDRDTPLGSINVFNPSGTTATSILVVDGS